MKIVNLTVAGSIQLSKRVIWQKELTRVETFLECKLTDEGSPVIVIHTGLDINAGSYRERP